jgi:monoamine oxidase
MKRATHFLLLLLLTFEVYSSCDLEVLVIGAGVSGLGAAQELLYKGCKVKVLEAQTRKGGRINSIPLGSNTVDIGASWIHGMGPGAGSLKRWKNIENPIRTIAKVSRITTVATWKDEDDALESFIGTKVLQVNSTLKKSTTCQMRSKTGWMKNKTRPARQILLKI